MIAGGLAGAASGAGAVATGIMDTIQSAMPQMSCTGSNGSMVDLELNPLLYHQFFRLVDEDNEDRGRPLCQKKQLRTIPGYQLIADPDIALRGTAEENAMIKQYLASGYFWE